MSKAWFLILLVAPAMACGADDGILRRTPAATPAATPDAPAGGAGGAAALEADNVAGVAQGDSAAPVAAELPGSAAAPTVDDCGGISVEAEAELLPTDVIWAIDTSGSMNASFPAIQQALNEFSTKIVDAGIDAHIILLAGASAALGSTTGLCVPPPLGAGPCGAAPVPGGVAPDSNEPTFLHLDLPFGANQGMGVLLDNHAAYAHLLRANARTQLVMTEDGVPPMTAQAVIDHLEGRVAATFVPAWDPPLLPGSWVFNGVVCQNGGGTGTCLLAFLPPATTLEFIQLSGGLVSDLDAAGNAGAADPFAALLEQLAEAVIVGAQLSCEYGIPQAPEGETLDPDRVNVRFTDGSQSQLTFPRLAAGIECADNEAWTYDDPAAPTQVLLCPAACERASSDAQAPST